jgi:hypothetical protein
VREKGRNGEKRECPARKRNKDKLLQTKQISFQLGNSLKEFAVTLPARQLAGIERRNRLLRAIQISFQLGNSLKEFLLPSIKIILQIINHKTMPKLTTYSTCVYIIAQHFPQNIIMGCVGMSTLGVALNFCMF